MVVSGENEIRGLDIDKAVRGFADEESIFKKFVINQSTSAREIRFYTKTAGFLDSTDTTGITASRIAQNAQGALPVIIEPSWTRKVANVRKYIVESPTISDEDTKDSDVGIMMTVIRDLTRAVVNQVDIRIYTVVSDTQATGSAGVLTTAAAGTGWDDATNGDPIGDILIAKRKIRQQSYNPEGAVLAMDSLAHEQLLRHLINVKGSSIPTFAGQLVQNPSVVMGLLGINILVSENVVTDSVTMWLPVRSATWKSFMGIGSATIVEPRIGTKFRVSEEGECILHDPKSVHVTTDTTTG